MWSEHFYVTDRKRKVIKIMRKEITIKEFITELNKKGSEYMFFRGGTSELFGVGSIKGKKVYLDDDIIFITDNDTPGMPWYELDKPSFISKIKEAVTKDLNEDVLKDIFKVDRIGHFYFKETYDGCIEVGY